MCGFPGLALAWASVALRCVALPRLALHPLSPSNQPCRPAVSCLTPHCLALPCLGQSTPIPWPSRQSHSLTLTTFTSQHQLPSFLPCVLHFLHPSVTGRLASFQAQQAAVAAYLPSAFARSTLGFLSLCLKHQSTRCIRFSIFAHDTLRSGSQSRVHTVSNLQHSYPFPSYCDLTPPRS